jgi:2'-5' RNA ligase
MHITLVHGAPMDRLLPGELDDLIGRLRLRLAQAEPVTMTLLQPTLGGTALVCPGTPAEPTRALWRACAEEVSTATGRRFPTQPAVHHPHTTLAYSTGTSGRHAQIEAWPSDHRADPVTFTIDRVTVVAQSHDGREITWRPLAEVPLGTDA